MCIQTHTHTQHALNERRLCVYNHDAIAMNPNDAHATAELAKMQLTKQL